MGPNTMMIYDDLTILMYRNIIKNNNNPSASKTVTRAPKIGTSSPIPDEMMMHDDLTILMYRNIIKNNNNPLPPSVTRAPKIGTSSPIPDTLMMYDHSYPLLTHHSNHLLTHSLTIGKKIESPRRSLRSLRSLWGLIKSCIVGVFNKFRIRSKKCHE